jgi:hypothetical protein
MQHWWRRLSESWNAIERPETLSMSSDLAHLSLGNCQSSIVIDAMWRLGNVVIDQRLHLR